jgi:hypothetical protein
MKSLYVLCQDALSHTLHPSVRELYNRREYLITPEEFGRLQELNAIRTAQPNTLGRVAAARGGSEFLTQFENMCRKTGRLQAFTRFWYEGSKQLRFKCDSFVHPDIRVSGFIPDIDAHGNTGRFGVSGRGRLVAEVRSWTLRINDMNNPLFWVEVDLPPNHRKRSSSCLSQVCTTSRSEPPKSSRG